MNPSIKKNIEQNIKDSGIGIVGVFGNMPFSYSIGAKLSGYPDIFLPYIDIRMAQGLINQLFGLMKDGEITEQCIVRGLIQNDLDLALIKVDKAFSPFVKEGFTVQAGQYYETETYDIYQVVIPDKFNRFPWNDAYEEFLSGDNYQKCYFYKDKIKTSNLPIINV